MKTLKNAMKMQEKIEIIIPGTEHTNQAKDNSAYVDFTLTVLSSLFGGATAVNGSGAYMSDDAGLVKEDITKVYAYAEEITPEKLSQVLEYVEKMKKQLDQECIGIELNGAFYLV